MFSIIVCSIRPEQAAALEQNIASTIGVSYEFIVYDNRAAGKGICAVYNECARRAKYDYLCFIHEDIAFHTQDWGREIAQKLSEQDCGAIGFAGGTSKYPYPYGWQSIRTFTCKNYIRGSLGGGSSLRKSREEGAYSQVVTLDGMALMVRRDVWAECNFDEVTFTGFHSYDTDFTTALFCGGRRNYVCNSVLIEHFSTGSFSTKWYESVKRYLAKWGERLPLFVEPKHTVRQIARLAPRVEAFALKYLLRHGLVERAEAVAMVDDFCARHPFAIQGLLMRLRLCKTE
ncbi:MAG: hypothetical protein IJ348_03790 [Alistipes sp.]|nr:hypothetical protein [Alistipes sp.]